MGEIQKIFYYHVSSAISIYLGVLISFIFSFLSIIKKSSVYDFIAWSGIEVSTLWSALVIITGMLWAKEVWGVYWVWDPRLTSVSILFSLFILYLIFRSSFRSSPLNTILILFISINAVFVHIAVKVWRGMHPTVIYKRGGLVKEMLLPFFLSLFSFFLLTIILIWLRTKIKCLGERIRKIEVERLIEDDR